MKSFPDLAKTLIFFLILEILREFIFADKSILGTSWELTLPDEEYLDFSLELTFAEMAQIRENR